MPRQSPSTSSAPPLRPRERREWAVDEDHSQEPALEKKERNVLGTLLKFVLLAALLAGVGTALVTRNWVLFGIALLVFVPYLFLIMAPLWLARSTHVAKRAEDGGGE